MTKAITIEVPEDVLRGFSGDEAHFGRELYEAAVVQWYHEGIISSGRGAEMLKISRAAFLELLFRHKVSPFQYTAEELAEELKGV